MGISSKSTIFTPIFLRGVLQDEQLTCRDMPPAGGYESVRYKRNLPVRGPSGVMIFAGVMAISAFGFWRYGQGNIEKKQVDSSSLRPRLFRVLRDGLY